MLEIFSLRPEHLIPLKARAWLDLRERKAAGHKVDSADINTHRKDVFRLYQIVDPAPLNETPMIVRDDMRRFLIDVRGESIDLKSLGIVRSSLDDVLGELGRIYGAG
jgi:hypothetical protein